MLDQCLVSSGFLGALPCTPRSPALQAPRSSFPHAFVARCVHFPFARYGLAHALHPRRVPQDIRFGNSSNLPREGPLVDSVQLHEVSPVSGFSLSLRFARGLVFFPSSIRSFFFYDLHVSHGGEECYAQVYQVVYSWALSVSSGIPGGIVS